MADRKVIQLTDKIGNIYDVKDTEAREDITELKSAINEADLIYTYSVNPGYISNSGSIEAPASGQLQVYTNKLPISIGDMLGYSESHSASHSIWCAYALYDESENFISRTVMKDNVSGTDYKTTVVIENSDAKYIVFTWKSYSDASVTIYNAIEDKLNTDIIVIGEKVTELNETVKNITGDQNILDVTTWLKNSIGNVVNNEDGTYTFSATGYGTVIWESKDIVPAGDYVLCGSPYGYTTVSFVASYEDGVVFTNNTGTDAVFTNSVERKLYVSLHLGSNPQSAFIFTPALLTKQNAIDGLQDYVDDFKEELKTPLVYSASQHAKLVNEDELKNISNRYAATLVGQVDGVRTFTFGDGTEVNPGVNHASMGLGTKKWMVGLKYRLSKVDQSVSTPDVVRIWIGSTSHDYDVTLDEWISFSLVDTTNFSGIGFYVRGFSPAPTSGQFKLELKDYYIYDVTALTDEMIAYVERKQNTLFQDYTANYTLSEAYATDETLTMAGKAADAKTVGDAIDAITGDMPRSVNVPFIGKYINPDGTDTDSSSSYCATDYIDLEGISAISYTGKMGSTACVFWYDDEKEFISSSLLAQDKMRWYENVYSLKPENAKYVRVQSKTLTATNPPDIAPEATAFYGNRYMELLMKNIVADGEEDVNLTIQKIVNMCENVTLPNRKNIILTAPVHIQLGYARIIDGNGVNLIVDDDFYALDIVGTLTGASDSSGMDEYVVMYEAGTIVKNFRITAPEGNIGGGIEATKAFKLTIANNYIHHCKNGIRVYGQCRDMIITANHLHSLYANSILFDKGCNLHQCNINNNIMMYAHDIIYFDEPSAIANFQITGNDCELGNFPPETYQTDTCITMKAGQSTGQFSEIEIVGNTLQAHNNCDYLILLAGIDSHELMEISIVGNHISNSDVNGIKAEYIKNVTIMGNTYKEIGGYVYGLDGDVTNVVIVGEAARVIQGKIHAASTASLNNIICKNVVFLTNNRNDIETSDVTNVDIA